MAYEVKVDDSVSRPVRTRALKSGCTVRAFVIGTAVAFLINVGAPYGNMALRGSYMALDFSTAAAIFVFFLVVGGLNTILGLMRRSWKLSAPELIVVYVMAIVACSIPTMGLTEYLLPILAGAFYYATPENDWASLIHPYIPDWLAPQSLERIKEFYEGGPKGAPIPWDVWIGPLLYWSIFLIALYLVMICVMVILRKQWMEKERLIYPMAQVPMAMIEEGRPGGLIGPFFRNPIMWAGFVIPMIVGSINAFHNYYRFIPGLNLVSTVSMFRRTVTFPLALSFPMVGFAYFINLDIAFGLWFFNFLVKIEEGLFGVFGYTTTEIVNYGAQPAMLAHQGMGAMMVLVIFGLWVGRGHLKEVFRKAFRRAPEVDDSGEILSYRAAVWGCIVGCAVMAVWMWRSGLPLWAIPLTLGSAFLLFVGITRIVVEGGVAVARAPLIPANFVVSGFGSSALGPAGLLSLGFTYIWAADIRTFVMASCANGLKLAEEMGPRKRPLFWAILLSVVVSIVGSIWLVMKLSYESGGINLNQWFFVGGPVVPFNYITPILNTPTEAVWSGWLFKGIGALAMGLLMIARQRLLWWPVHPLALPICGLLTTNQIFFSVFLAWLIKAVMLKYGGPKLYRSSRPFFLGLILGQFVCAGMWLVIDYFTGMTDNQIYWI